MRAFLLLAFLVSFLMNSSITLNAVLLQSTFPWIKLQNRSLSFITNNPGKIAICLFLEFAEVLRSKSGVLQGCSSRGLDSAIHVLVFPCPSHLALPPSAGIILQSACKTRFSCFLYALAGTCPSQPHRCALALQYCSSLLQFPREPLCQPE